MQPWLCTLEISTSRARACRDKLKQAKGWMKEQHIPHDQALVALQYLQQSFKSKAVHGKDGKPECAIQNFCGHGVAQCCYKLTKLSSGRGAE